MEWAMTNVFHFQFKAPWQMASTVEQHNEILRQALQHTETQLRKEGVICACRQVPAMVTFMRSALTVINTSTPYQAVLERQASMLPPLEAGHAGQRGGG